MGAGKGFAMAVAILVHVAMSQGVSTKKDDLTSQNAAVPRNIVG